MGISVFFLWRYTLAWWTKATAFTMADLAFLGVINGYFGSYLLLNQKFVILTVGSLLIPIVFIASYLSVSKARDARVSAWRRLIASLGAFDRGLHEGLIRSSRSPLMTQQKARELVVAEVRRERDSPPPVEEVRISSVESEGETFHVRGTQPWPTLAGVQIDDFEAWVNRRTGTCHVKHFPRA
jgi:hypothetical protein